MSLPEILAKSFKIYILLGSIYTSGPLMVSLSEKMSTKKLNQIVFVENLAAFFLAIFFAHFGAPALKAVGISLSALKFTGGILLFFTGFELLGLKSSQNGMLNADSEMFLVPIAFPILAGPATLFTIASMPRNDILTTDISIIIGCVLTFVTMRIFAWNVNYICKTSTLMISKFAGLFVSAIAAQMLLDGFWNFTK